MGQGPSQEPGRARRTRVNAANRAFGALVGVAALPVVLVAVAGCGVFGFVVFRLSTDGVSGLTADEDLRPAVAFLAVFLVGLGVGVRALVGQVVATRRLGRAVERVAVAPSPQLRALAERCKVGRRLVLVPADEVFSFAYGFGTPAVAVSTGLVDAFSDDEIVAVLEHERYHVRARDPLKVVTARTLTAAFFYLPVLRPLLEDRVHHLETGDERAPSPLPVLAVTATVVVIALLIAALLYTVIEAGGPAGLMRGRMDGDMDDMGASTLPGILVSVAPWLLGAGWLWQRRRRRRA